jgi:hypothetical protein
MMLAATRTVGNSVIIQFFLCKYFIGTFLICGSKSKATRYVLDTIGYLLRSNMLGCGHLLATVETGRHQHRRERIHCLHQTFI